jgi:hypothetical protein
MTTKYKFILLLLLTIILGCSEKEPTPKATTLTTDPVIEHHLREIIGLMRNYSINRKIIDWNSFEKQTLNLALGAQTIEQAEVAILSALTTLNDRHSFYITPNGKTIRANSSCFNSNPSLNIPLPKDIAYVKISGFSGTSEAATIFAEEIQNAIRKKDNDDIKSWIVDLRGNSGGNMWPMLAGVGPILGEGILGYFIDPDGVEQVWGYSQGQSIFANNTAIAVSEPYRLKNPNPKVAVLTNGATASSGEAVVIAFKQRPNTRSFGAGTCGLSTANRTLILSNNSLLLLTVSTMADRNKNMYGLSVTPDVLQEGDDAPVRKAIEWLSQ